MVSSKNRNNHRNHGCGLVEIAFKASLSERNVKLSIH